MKPPHKASRKTGKLAEQQVLDTIDINSQAGPGNPPIPPIMVTASTVAGSLETEEIFHCGTSYRLSARRSSILKLGEAQMERRSSRRVSWAKTFQCKERMSDGTTVVTSQELNKYGPELPAGGLPIPSLPEPVKIGSAAKSKHLEQVLNTYYDKSNAKDHETVVNTVLNKFNIEIDATDREKNWAKVDDLLQNNIVSLDDLGLLVGSDQNKAPVFKGPAESISLETITAEINTSTSTRRYFNSTQIPLDQSTLQDPLMMTEQSPIKPMNMSEDEEKALVSGQNPKTVYEPTLMSVNSDKGMSRPTDKDTNIDDLSLDDLSPVKTGPTESLPPSKEKQSKYHIDLSFDMSSSSKSISMSESPIAKSSDLTPVVAMDISMDMESVEQQKEEASIELDESGKKSAADNKSARNNPQPTVETDAVVIADLSFGMDSDHLLETKTEDQGKPEQQENLQPEEAKSVEPIIDKSKEPNSSFDLSKIVSICPTEPEESEHSLTRKPIEEAKSIQQNTSFNLSGIVSISPTEPDEPDHILDTKLMEKVQSIQQNTIFNLSKIVSKCPTEPDESYHSLATKTIQKDSSFSFCGQQGQDCSLENSCLAQETNAINVEFSPHKEVEDEENKTKVDVIEITREENRSGDYEPTQPLLLGKSATQILEENYPQSQVNVEASSKIQEPGEPDDINRSAKRPSPSRDGDKSYVKIMRLEEPNKKSFIEPPPPPKEMINSSALVAQITCSLQKFSSNKKSSLVGFGGSKTFVRQQHSSTKVEIPRASVVTAASSFRVSLAPSVPKVLIKPSNNILDDDADGDSLFSQPTGSIKHPAAFSLRDKLLAKINQQGEQQQLSVAINELNPVENEKVDELEGELPNAETSLETVAKLEEESNKSGSSEVCLSPIKPPEPMSMQEEEEEDALSFYDDDDDEEVILNETTINHDFTQLLHELSLDKDSLPMVEVSMYKPLPLEADPSQHPELRMFDFIKLIDLYHLNVRIQSISDQMLVLRYLYSTIELRIHFGSPIGNISPNQEVGALPREIVALDLVDLIYGKPLPERVMRGLQDRPLYDGDEYRLMFEEEHRPLLMLAHDCLVTRFEEKRQFFKKTFTDTRKLPDLLHELSMLVTPAKELANELLYLTCKHFVELLPKDSDGCFRMTIELLGVRRNSPIQLYISVDHLAYPDKVIRPTVKVPEKDQHLYPLELFSEALLMIKPCQYQYQYLTKLIWAATRFVMALRNSMKQTKKRAQQSEAIRNARFALNRS